MKPMRIGIAEFLRRSEHYLALGRNQLVTIIEPGQEDLVLLNAAEYANLRSWGQPVAIPVEALSEAELREIESSPIPEESRELDRLLPKD